MPRFKPDKRTEIPQSPGVYGFFDTAAHLLYIGKAKNLRDRVKSYFAKTVERGPQVLEMLPKIASILIEETDSEIEALLLEARLVRQLQPEANTQLKDAKSFLVLALFDGDFPSLQFIRQRDLEAARAGKLYGQKIKETYGPFLQPGQVRAAMKVIRKILPYRDCSPSKFETYRKAGRPCLYGFLKLCPAPCVGRIERAEYLGRIRQLDRMLLGKKELVKKMLEKEMQRASRRKQFELAARLRDQARGLDHLREVSLLESERAIPDQPTLRTEAFDISLTSGTNAVGSMVVYTNDKPNHSQYRRFRIKGSSTEGDLKMMQEVLTRRLQRCTRTEDKVCWPLPGLWLIDGGREHLKIAEAVVRQFEYDIPVMAVAKGPERKKAEVFYSDEGRIRRLTQAFDFDKFVRGLRDEAHRFAITYHRNIRSKKSFSSLFDQIPGIGPASRRALLMHFGSAMAVHRASEAELAKVVGPAKAKTVCQYLAAEAAQSS